MFRILHLSDIHIGKTYEETESIACKIASDIDAFDSFVTHQNQKKEFLLRVCIADAKQIVLKLRKKR